MVLSVSRGQIGSLQRYEKRWMVYRGSPMDFRVIFCRYYWGFVGEMSDMQKIWIF
jgi:hypothetical protein